MRRRLLASEKAKCAHVFIAVAVFALLCFTTPVKAVFEIPIGDKPLTIMGYVNQSVGYGLHDTFDTKGGFNSYLTQALIEGKYAPASNLTLFGSLKLNADWAYAAYAGSGPWKDRLYDEARDRLFIYNQPRDYVQEAHVTWKPGDFLFRVGKQVVQWGETDGFLLTNQINPIDQRRGLTDVEFESTIIPIWLVRAEYAPPAIVPGVQDLNLQFIWNPNMDFARNRSIELGGDYSGIWNPNIKVPLGGPVPPFDYAHLARYNDQLSYPKGTFDPQGMAFGGRISGQVQDARVTLNGYYGRDHDVARKALPLPPTIGISPYDNRLLIGPAYEAYYPIFKFVGATVGKDLDFLRSGALGGVSPVLRFEGMYAFNSTFSSNNSQPIPDFFVTDEIRYMVGADWKIKVNALNPLAYFTISGQFYHQHLMNYPSVGHVGNYITDIVYKDNYTTTLMVSTTYLHNKLQPSIFWLRNWSNRSEFVRPQISYEYSDTWKYTLGGIVFIGEKEGQGFEPFNNKDQVYFTVSYKF
ncbi:MAG: hypothetical protein A4E65_03062 [Syntrophorhabdus sp. PtaU1.Bin153]|nr:MAG: hypothetical protein A4E65_03062 [Syntrophorhabdus sp. PtaU1.Bin153]